MWPSPGPPLLTGQAGRRRSQGAPTERLAAGPEPTSGLGSQGNQGLCSAADGAAFSRPAAHRRVSPTGPCWCRAGRRVGRPAPVQPPPQPRACNFHFRSSRAEETGHRAAPRRVLFPRLALGVRPRPACALSTAWKRRPRVSTVGFPFLFKVLGMLGSAMELLTRGPRPASLGARTRRRTAGLVQALRCGRLQGPGNRSAPAVLPCSLRLSLPLPLFLQPWK